MKVHQWWVVDGWIDEDNGLRIDGEVAGIFGSLDEAQEFGRGHACVKIVHVSYHTRTGEVRSYVENGLGVIPS